MSKTCDNTSAAVIIYNNRNEILLIERGSWPYGFAVPAGHLDGDNPEEGAAREVAEEVGLTILESELILKEKVYNPCKRENGTNHNWFIYKSKSWDGEPFVRKDEKGKIKKISWVSAEDLKLLGKKTENFARKHNLYLWQNITLLTRVLSNCKDWQEDPGLEPVWYYIFKKLALI